MLHHLEDILSNVDVKSVIKFTNDLLFCEKVEIILLNISVVFSVCLSQLI